MIYLSFKQIWHPTGWFFKQTKLSQKFINKPYSVPTKKQQLCSVKFPPSSSSANTSIMICPSLSLLKNRNDTHAVESFPLSSFAHKPSSISPSRNCLIWQINSSIKESETYIFDVIVATEEKHSTFNSIISSSSHILLNVILSFTVFSLL